MRRLLLDQDPDALGRLVVEGKDAHYLLRVLRLGPGGLFRALSPLGNTEYELQIERCEHGRLECRVLQKDAGEEAQRDIKRRSALGALPPLILMQAWPKGQKLDLIVRQAVEAGVGDCIVFIADHSLVRLSKDDLLSKKARLERIAKEALQQSGASTPCRIHTFGSLDEALDCRKGLAEGCKQPLSLLMHQDTLAQNSLHQYLDSTPDSLALAVGPEGGFSSRECALCLSRGYAPFLLGPNVLRTETAALFALAAVEIIILERSSWQISSLSCPE